MSGAPPDPAGGSRLPFLVRRWGLAMTILTLTLAGAARAQDDGVAVRTHARLEPGSVKLGETTVYHGRVILGQWQEAKWLPPEPDDALTWGPLAPRRIPGAESGRDDDPEARRRPAPIPLDTLEVEASLQSFRTGVIPIPGLRFQITTGGHTEVHRLPNVNLIVTSVLTPADSNADLRPLRGPIGAPWWERVPWLLVALGALLLGAGAVALVVWRRRPAPAPVAAPPPDPATIALTELNALRGLNLPGHGRFGEHALHLTRILKCFLEVQMQAPCPGDTTSELLAHLESTGMSPDERHMLEGLLNLWDRLKFAGVPSTVPEAERAEQAVERVIRKHAAPAVERVA